MRSAIVLGAGGHARVVSAILNANGIGIRGFLDDSYVLNKKELIKHGYLIGKLDNLSDYSPVENEVYLATGNSLHRRELFESVVHCGFELPSAFHPKAFVEEDCFMGKASIVCLGALLATEVTLGNGVIINTGASIDHESHVGDFSHVAPNATVAGRVHIGRSVFVGMGACIAQNLTIGDGAVIGAGAIILKDVLPGSRVLGLHH